MEGIREETLSELFKKFYEDEAMRVDELETLLIAACIELDPWLPIAEAPEGKKGFLAMSKDRCNIEWLSDIGEAKFYNNNSHNFTDKSNWTHYKELPMPPPTNPDSSPKAPSANVCPGVV